MADITQTTPVESPAETTPASPEAPATESVNPYFAIAKWRLGKTLTPAEATVVGQYTSAPTAFEATYGRRVGDAIRQAESDAQRATEDAVYGNQESFLSVNSARNFIKGATTGVVNLGEGLVELAPESKAKRALMNSLKDTNKGITEVLDYGKSDEQKAAERAYDRFKEISNAESDMYYNQARAAGIDETTAKLAREGRNAVNAFKNAWHSGRYISDISTNSGSMLPILLGTKGIGATGSLTAKVAERAIGAKRLAAAADAVAKAPTLQATINGIKEAAPWMVSNALVEGGNASETVREAAEGMSVDDLYANSPEFVNKVLEKVNQLPEDKQDDENVLKEIETETRQELIDEAARAAAIRHGINAGLASWFTKGMGKWATPEKFTKSSAYDGIKDAVLDAWVEEPATEFSGAYTPNKVIQEKLDKRVDPIAGTGEATGLAPLSTMGISAIHAPSVAIATMREADIALQNHRDEKQAQDISVRADNIKQFLSPGTEGLATVAQDLPNLRKDVLSETLTTPEGKQKDKTVQDLYSDLDRVHEAINQTNSATTGKDVSDEDRVTVDTFIKDTKSSLEKLKSQIEQRINSKLTPTLQKLKDNPSYIPSHQEVLDVSNYLERRTNEVVSRLSGKPEEQEYIRKFLINVVSHWSPDQVREFAYRDDIPEAIRSAAQNFLHYGNANDKGYSAQDITDPGNVTQGTQQPNPNNPQPNPQPASDPLKAFDDLIDNVDKNPTRSVVDIINVLANYENLTGNTTPEQETKVQALFKKLVDETLNQRNPSNTGALTPQEVGTEIKGLLGFMQLADPTADIPTILKQHFGNLTDKQINQVLTTMTKHPNLADNGNFVRDELTQAGLLSSEEFTDAEKSNAGKPQPKPQPNPNPNPNPQPQPQPVPPTPVPPTPVPPAPAPSNPNEGTNPAEGAPAPEAGNTEASSDIGNVIQEHSYKTYSGHNLKVLVTDKGIYLQVGNKAPRKLSEMLPEHPVTAVVEDLFSRVTSTEKAKNTNLEDFWNIYLTRHPEERDPNKPTEPEQVNTESSSAEEATSENQTTTELNDPSLDISTCSDNDLNYTSLDANNPNRNKAKEELNKRNLVQTVTENGEVEIEKRAVSVISKQVKAKMGEVLNKFFTPVKRTVHLLLLKNPIDNLKDLITKDGRFEKLLRQNNFVNADSILSALEADNGKLKKEIAEVLDRRGPFVSKLLKHFQEFTAKNPMFKDNKDQMAEILTLVAIQDIATLGNYKHPLTSDELAKNNFEHVEEKQPNLDETASGTYYNDFFVNTEATLRKFLGVAIRSDAQIDDVNKFLADTAINIIETLQKEGFIEQFTVDLVRESEDSEGYKKSETVAAVFFRPTEAYDGRFRIFANKAGILEAVINPNFKNVLHFTPPEQNKIIAHSSVGATKEQIKAAQRMASVAHKLNMPLVNAISKLGTSIFYGLFNTVTDPSDQKFRNQKGYASAKGRLLSYETGISHLKEVLRSQRSKFYYAYRILKNGRYQQEGPATEQGSKIVRACVDTEHANIDLSNQDAEINKFWMAALAQSLGYSVNKENLMIVLPKIQDFVNRVDADLNKFAVFKELLKTSKEDNQNFLNDDFRNEELGQRLKKAINEFNKINLDLQINNAQSFNAALELYRYLTADDIQRMDFDSHIYLEIDGINDGPHYISAFFGAIYQDYSADYIERAQSTGLYFGSKAIATLANDPDLFDDAIWEERKKLMKPEDIAEIEEYRNTAFKALGVTGKDFHSQVATVAIPRTVLSRVIAINNTRNDAAKALQLEELGAFLTLAKAAGYLITDKSIDEILATKQMPKDNNFGFKFSRDISKKLTTIIPYGSMAKGTSVQLFQMILKGFRGKPGLLEMLNQKLAERTQNTATEDQQRKVNRFEKAMTQGTTFVIDTETTGRDVNSDKVVQIAVQRLDKGKTSGEPVIIWIDTDEAQIPKEIDGKPNPLLEAYAKAKREGRVIPVTQAAVELQKLLGNNPVMGHNIDAFDIPILKQHLKLPLQNETFDSLDLSRTLRPGRPNSLQAIAAEYGISVAEGTAHTADSDIATNVSVVRKLLAEAKGYKPKVVKADEIKESDNELNGVHWNDIIDALTSLMTITYNKRTGTFNRDVGSLDKRARNLVRLPSREELNDPNVSYYQLGNKIGKKVGSAKEFDFNIIQNLEIFASGIENAAEGLTILIGESAQAGVEDTVGKTAMQVERFVALIGLAGSIVGRFSELTLPKPKTYAEYLEQRAILNNLSGKVTVGGTRIFAEKKGKALSEEPVAESKELGGLKFYNSELHIGSAGVGMGPVLIQAMGDSSMQRNFWNANNNGKTPKAIHDGLDATAAEAKEVEREANIASTQAMEMQLFEGLYNTFNTWGRTLIANKLVEATDPIEAVKEAILKAAKTDDTGKQISYEFIRSVLTAREAQAFTPNPEKAFADKEHIRKIIAKSSLGAEARARVIEEQLDWFISEFRVIRAREKSARMTEKQMPKSVNHMAAVGNAYNQRGALSNNAWVNLVDQVTNLGVKGITTGSQLKAAYMRTLRKSFRDECIKDLTPEEVQAYDQYSASMFTGEAQVLPPEAMKLVDEAFGIKREEDKTKEVTENTKILLQKAISDMYLRGQTLQDRNEKLWGKILQRVSQFLPRTLADAEIHIERSVSDFPADIQTFFIKDKAKGHFRYKNGKAEIYLLGDPQKGIKDWTKEEKTILLHELVHAALNAHVMTFYGVNTGVKLTETQKASMTNLDHLLDQFVEMDVSDRLPVVKQFQKLLKSFKDNKITRMDEALAYILSQQDLFYAMKDLQFSKDSAENERIHKEESNKLIDLLTNVTNIAKKIINSIIGIFSKQIVNELNPQDFTSVFGLNTLVFLEFDNGNPDYHEPNDPQKPKKFQRPKLNSDLNSSGSNYKSLIDPLVEKKFSRDLFESVFASQIIPNRREYQHAGYEKIANKWRMADAGRAKVARFINLLEMNLGSEMDKAGDVAELAASFMEPHFLNAHQRDDLTKGYLQLRGKIKDDFLIKDPSKATKEELEASAKAARILRGEESIFKLADVGLSSLLDQNFEAPALFYAVAVKNPDLFKGLGNINYKPEKRQSKAGEGLFQKGLASLAVAIKNQLEGELHSNSAEDLAMKAIRDADAIFNRSADTLVDKGARWSRRFDKRMDERIYKVLNKGFELVTRKKGLSNEAIKNILANPVGMHARVADFLAALNNRFVTNVDFNATLADFYGRTAGNTLIQALLKKIKGSLDTSRSQHLKELPELMEAAYHRKLKGKDKAFLDRTIRATDIRVYSDDIEKACKLLSDVSEVQKEWDALVKDLEVEIGKARTSEVLTKVNQFGDWQSGSRKSGHNLLTNPEAILALLNTRRADTQVLDNHAKAIPMVDKLMTLACIKQLKNGDRLQLQDFIGNEKEGITSTIYWLAASHLAEQERLNKTAKQETEEKSDKNASYRFNRIKGWAPQGNLPKGLYRLVPEDQVTDFKRDGYKDLGVYKGSNIDPSKKLVRMWCPHPYQQDLQEGVLQSINQTAFGYQVLNGTRGEAIGTRITDNVAANAIYSNYSAENSDEGVMPLFDSKGAVIGYERSIPAEDRHYIEEHNDVFSGIGQWHVRQEREEQAGEINKEVIDILAEIYNKATSEQKRREFIDVFASKDEAIQKAVSRFDSKTRARIKKKFGEHLWVRRDSVYSVIGYYSASPTDMWNGSFFLPKKMQKTIVKVLEALFGIKAKYYVGRGFDIWRGAVSTVRDTIIVRSIGVPIANIASNLFMLHFCLGVPLTDLVRLATQAVVATEEYAKLNKKKIELQAKLVDPRNDRAKIEKQLNDIDLRIKNLPVYKLIEAGEFSTISSQGRIFEDIDFLKQDKADLLEYAGSKIPKSLQTLGSNILLTKNSELYQALAKMVNYGDWIAKCVGYAYLRENSATRDVFMSDEAARDAVSTLFIDYDQFVSRGRRFLNEIGFSWFNTFKYRMVPAAMLAMMINPFRTLVGTAAGIATGVGTPLTDNWIIKLLNGDLWSSIGFSAIARGLSLHPLMQVL